MKKSEPNSGGLFSITINPQTCKGCMECVEVCDDDALRIVTQTEKSIGKLNKEWDFWLDLPSTPKNSVALMTWKKKSVHWRPFCSIRCLPQFASGDGACLGCSEKSVVHLFTATVESLMQPRIKKHVAHLDDLMKSSKITSKANCSIQ
jgi:pyruvate-ferredoxin/flavodoxin oxidoreductase